MGLFSWLQIGAGAALGVLVSVLPAYMYGHSQGYNAAQVDQLKASVEAQAKREGIENEVSDMDRYAICIDLGGLPDQCKQLRGMEKSTKTK